jgi:hypothetical protein
MKFRPQGLQAAGPRVLTFFLYLSDVEEGGETAFPLLGIAVKPKKGKALLWPSVLDHDLQEFEPRTLHEVPILDVVCVLVCEGGCVCVCVCVCVCLCVCVWS